MKNEEPNNYQRMQRLADLTKQWLLQGNIERSKRCMQIVENAFLKGTYELKNSISNVFIYSVSAFMEINHFNVEQLLPEVLFKEYRQQINTSCI